jgi:hypothetical protein
MKLELLMPPPRPASQELSRWRMTEHWKLPEPLWDRLKKINLIRRRSISGPRCPDFRQDQSVLL